jgi:hypothetical protein
MKRVARRPTLVVLDAGAVFGALEHGAWVPLTNSYEVVLPQIVMNEIQFFVSRETGEKVYVDPQEWIEEGKVHPYEATAIELAGTMSQINAPDGPEIHEGEAEALTYLRLETDPEAADVAFVSADGAAIQATVLLELSHTAKSLAEVLEAVGFSKPLADRHQRPFVDRHLQKGLERKLRR